MFEKICTSTVMIVMLATSVLMTAFFATLYFVMQKKKSMLYLFCAGIAQLVLVLFLYMEKITGDLGYLMMGNITNVLLTTFWVSAVFVILEIKATKLVLAAFNAVNVAQAFIFYLSTGTNHIVNIISALIMVFMSFHCVGKILVPPKKEKRREIVNTAVIFALFGVLNAVRAVYRIFNPQYLGSFSELDSSGALFLIVSLAFSYLVNFLILFLHFNDLNLTIQRLLRTDSLTGVLSRDTFYLMAQQKVKEVKRHNRNIALALLDIDNFKHINDTYGHQMGDKVLAWFAQTMKSCLRENDILGRIGGEEFMLVLETETSKDAHSALSRMKKSLEMSEDKAVDEKITFSGGVVFIDSNNSSISLSDIIKEADDKMYEAKRQGKNLIL